MSGRWFRFYDETLNETKALKLSDETFRVWVNLLCIASKNGGKFPPFDDLLIMLRTTTERLQPQIETLIAAGLIDHDDRGMRPHNWNKRQYKSDVSTSRVKRFRNGKRNVSETPPETEQIQITETEQKDAADAADPRSSLFGRGLKSLAQMTGKTPDSCRSVVGKWLKSVNDEAIHVLAAIEDAERNRVADPVAWINKSLQPRNTPNAKAPSAIMSAIDGHIERLEGRRDSEMREASPRMLPHR